jgi:uncharacterized membrane protein YphA (DoxX/SURF4 family)
MLRWLLIGFLIAHGLVHLAIWAPKYDPEKAFDPSHSWLIGDQRPLAQVLAFAAGAILIVAGIALWAHGEWWRPTAIVGLSVSTILLLQVESPAARQAICRSPERRRGHERGGDHDACGCQKPATIPTKAASWAIA